MSSRASTSITPKKNKNVKPPVQTTRYDQNGRRVVVEAHGIPNMFWYMVAAGGVIIGLYLIYQLLSTRVLVAICVVALGIPLLKLAGHVYSVRSQADVSIYHEQVELAARQSHVRGQVEIREMEKEENLYKLGNQHDEQKVRLSNALKGVEITAQVRLEEIKRANHLELKNN